jgi:hypothetical protein
MSDPDPVAPYTGRTSEPEAPASPAPRIRWGRMTALQLGAGAVAGFAVPGVAAISDPQWIPIAIVSGFVVALIGGGLPLFGAWLAHVIATRGGRAFGREVGAVVIGALVGALPIGLLLMSFVGTYGLILVAVIGIGSAIGFAIWVLVAWRHWLQSRPVR